MMNATRRYSDIPKLGDRIVKLFKYVFILFCKWFHIFTIVPDTTHTIIKFIIKFINIVGFPITFHSFYVPFVVATCIRCVFGITI